MNDNEATEYTAEFTEEDNNDEFEENPFMEAEEVDTSANYMFLMMNVYLQKKKMSTLL
jgi:ligand-binding sensor protein